MASFLFHQMFNYVAQLEWGRPAALDVGGHGDFTRCPTMFIWWKKLPDNSITRLYR
jgi:hypothetical protein